jgi:hypothetical protein
MATAPGIRVIRSVKMKGNQPTIWRPLLKLRPWDITYGHWWFEIGDSRQVASESYGWWPRMLDSGWRLIRDTLFGVAGELNGSTLYPTGRADRDPHHGEECGDAFYVAIEQMIPGQIGRLNNASAISPGAAAGSGSGSSAWGVTARRFRRPPCGTAI